MTISIITIKTEHILIVCRSYKSKHTWINIRENKNTQHSYKVRNSYSPSPNPKHGIILSSSKEDRVRPTMEIACSYGLGVFPIWCRLFRWNEYLPTIIKVSFFSTFIYIYHIYNSFIFKRNNNLSIHCFWWSQYQGLNLKIPDQLLSEQKQPESVIYLL